LTYTISPSCGLYVNGGYYGSIASGTLDVGYGTCVNGGLGGGAGGQGQRWTITSAGLLVESCTESWGNRVVSSQLVKWSA